MYVFDFRKMARSLNSHCDFKEGFFTCNLPIDTVELVLKVKTIKGKHTLKEDRERRTEKDRPWDRWTDDDDASQNRKLDSVLPSMTSDSGPWLLTLPEFQYKPKLFDDPRNVHSDKENMPPLEPIPMPVLNIAESNILDRTEKLLEKDMNWEAHIAQQVPLPRSSSPYPDDKSGSLEQWEPETDDDMDVRDFSERPANDKRPPKPKHGPNLIIQNFFPSPLTCPLYIAMNAAAAEPTKPHLKEVRGILPKKKKIPRGWPACLKRLPKKAAFQNNDIYAVHTSDDEHHFEEPKEKESQEEKEPKAKNMRVFYKLHIKDKVYLSNTPHEEEYMDENYESIEEWETAM